MNSDADIIARAKREFGRHVDVEGHRFGRLFTVLLEPEEPLTITPEPMVANEVTIPYAEVLLWRDGGKLRGSVTKRSP